MKPAGADSFEELVARLFEAETRQRFFLARTGDQPAGDAYGPEAHIVLQVKCITSSTIREGDIEGDINRALREVPALDVYVVATTKASNQLKLRLEQRTRETGLDIVLLALTDSLSVFGALCVMHWNVLRHFFPDLDTVSDAWANLERSKPATLLELERLRNELSSLPTLQAIATLASGTLDRRFNGEVLGSHGHNRILLTEAVQRQVTEKVAETWWREPKKGAAVLEGDEGNGKTWIAAAIAREIVSRENAPVFWLDSLAWTNIRNIQELVRAALRTTLPPGDEERLQRVYRKALLRWVMPVLIILDGANEREAWKAAENLLHDYDQHRERLFPHVRLLFTSRRLEHRPYGGANFWQSAELTRVGTFSSEEFRAALNRFAPDLSPEDLPSSIRDLALVPRYLRLCISLRERLNSISHVTKELLLWMDLEEKLANRDPQWVTIQTELYGSPQEILSRLARSAQWPADMHGTALPRAELLRELSGYDRVRHDLQEQRIFLSVDSSEALISADHLILGWALVLWEVTKKYASDGSDALCDRLQRILEPAASNDHKARAIHVAALLTFLDRAPNATGRVALLRLWTSHHNVTLTVETLRFFACADLNSYIEMVESFFRDHLGGQFESTLIAPLAILWRSKDGNIEALEYVLKRWLSLIFPGDTSGSQERDETPPANFAIAESAEQLRLSYAAVSIISFRPTFHLLPSLIDCYRSDHFTYQDFDAKDHKIRAPLKSSAESLEILARWHFGEEAIPIVAEFANRLPRDGEEWCTLRWFARLWRLAKLPDSLGAAEDIYQRHPPEIPVLEEFRTYLLDIPSKRPSSIGLGELRRLAVRRDQPDLSPPEIEALIVKLRERISATAQYSRYHATQEEQILDDLLPWLARSAPPEFNRQFCELWKTAINSEETLERLLHLDEMLPATDPGGGLVQVIMGRCGHFSVPRHADAAAIPLTEALLLHASVEDLHSWLKSLESQALTRGGGPVVGLSPLPLAMKSLAPPALVEIARQEVENAIEVLRHAAPTDASSRNRLSHWLQIYSATVIPTRSTALWALSLADQFSPDDSLQFSLFHIASRSPDIETLRRAVAHPAFRRYQFGAAARHWMDCEVDISWFTFADLFRVASFTVIGRILQRANLDEELRVWGYSVTAVAMSELNATNPNAAAWVTIETRATPEGELDGFGIGDVPQGGENYFSISSGVWGVDRESIRPAPTEADYERRLQELHETIRARQATGRREIAEFNAVAALWRWSELEPKAFTAFAHEFLRATSASDWTTLRDFGFFSDAVWIGLLRLDPLNALSLTRPKSRVHKTVILSLDCDIDWAITALWEKRLNSFSEVKAARRNALLTAKDDEALLWHATSALYADNAPELTAMASDLASASAALERALAVTLLAYLGDETSAGILAQMQANDESFWVRKHAEWAYEVCLTEIACRSRYRVAVEAESLDFLVPDLAEIRMALSPLAHAWRRPIEHHSIKLSQNPRNRAYLDLFWYHWGATSSHKRNIKMCGRELQQYCRGEKLKNGVTNRMAPWWQPDDL